MMSLEHCRISWCDLRQPHNNRHEATLGQWFGTVPGLRQPRTLQLNVYGHGERPVFPVVTLIDPRTLVQWNVEVAWADLLQLTAQAELAAGRFREGR